MILTKRALLLALTLILAGPGVSSAQTSPPPLLDNDDMVHLKSVREQVLAAHPDLQAEADKLKIAHDAMQAQNPPPTAEQINAAYAEWKDYQTKVRAEMLKIDPTLKPLFDKIDDARKHGAPAPFSSTTGQK